DSNSFRARSLAFWRDRPVPRGAIVSGLWHFSCMARMMMYSGSPDRRESPHFHPPWERAMKRFATSALAAVLVVAGSAGVARAQDMTVRTAPQFDIGIFAG